MTEKMAKSRVSKSTDNPIEKINATRSFLICKGVKTHNLKSIDVEIEMGKWTAVTGVSGSGKSSLVFDTIYAESQRRFLETLGTYERQFMQGMVQGEFDEIQNVPAAVALKQSNRTGDPRSLIGTTSDLLDPFRTLFVALMDKSCVKCGSGVVVDLPDDLKLFLEQELGKKNDGLAITVPLKLPSVKKERKLLLDTLLAEGYFRIVVDDVVMDTQEVEPASFPSDVFLLLDFFSGSIAREELANRVETLWSQVRFSPRFQNLRVRNSKLNLERLFHVQPFCSKCDSHTQVILAGDLDWQSALGSCRSCHGLGNIPVIDRSKVLPNLDLSIEEGAIRPWSTDTYSWAVEGLKKIMRVLKIKVSEPFHSLPADFKEFVWTGKWPGGKFSEYVSLNDWFSGLEAERYKPTSRILLAKYRKYIKCESCDGERLGPAGRNAKCDGVSYSSLMKMELHETLGWLQTLTKKESNLQKLEALREIFDELHKKLSLLVKLGLGTSSLSRRCKTLSGGEYQRVLLTRVIGNGLSDALYVLDEPSVGLGRTEVTNLIEALKELRDLGNTVLMVEHDPLLIRSADKVIELGPGGGSKGGYLGALKPGCDPESMVVNLPESSHAKRSKIEAKKNHFNAQKSIILNGFSHLNCINISLTVPLGQLTVLTGVSGAGKTTLLSCGLAAALEKAQSHGESLAKSNDESSLDDGIGCWDEFLMPKNLLQSHEILTVEQKAMHRVSSSVPATVLGIMDPLRKMFAQTEEAKRSGFGPSDFSFNGAGGCETCNGKGNIKDDLFFLGEVEKECPECLGSRYRHDVCEIRFVGKSINEWLGTSLEDCMAAFKSISSLQKPLDLCVKLGLGHLPLGVSTTQLSGGEAQRLRMCATLSKSTKAMICLLDEPTRGLSEKDVGTLIASLLQLTKVGHTFVVVEHHEEIQKCAHQLVVLGPGGGNEGGRVVLREAIVAQLN